MLRLEKTENFYNVNYLKTNKGFIAINNIIFYDKDKEIKARGWFGHGSNNDYIFTEIDCEEPVKVLKVDKTKNKVFYIKDNTCTYDIRYTLYIPINTNYLKFDKVIVDNIVYNQYILKCNNSKNNEDIYFKVYVDDLCNEANNIRYEIEEIAKTKITGYMLKYENEEFKKAIKQINKLEKQYEKELIKVDEIMKNIDITKEYVKK